MTNKKTKTQPAKTLGRMDRKPVESSPRRSEPVGPLIGILGWNSPRFAESHQGILEVLKGAISTMGGHPVVIGVSGGADRFPSDANGQDPATPDLRQILCARYGLPSRDIVADQVEVIVHEEHLDGIVFVPWSVGSLVGMMMAAARCNVPVIFSPNYRSWPSLAAGADKESSGPAYAQFSMLVLLEVFGLAKIGTLAQLFKHNPAKKPAKPFAPQTIEVSGESKIGEDAQFHEIAEWCGKRIVDLAKQKVSPKRFFTEASFHNAVCVDLALGGAAETPLHLGAIAGEAGVVLTPASLNDSARRVAPLVQANKHGDVPLDEIEKSGGLNLLLGALHDHIQAAPNISGKNLSEISRDHSALKSSFRVQGARKPGGLSVLFGNLAQEGALFRLTGLKESWLSGSGAVRVFHSEEACAEAVRAKKIKKGEVLVIRYCGPRGRPGMPLIGGPLKSALAHAGMEEAVLILTDGRVCLSGKTPAIVHVSPEAAVGSTLSILQDGDMVFWNYHDRALTARLTETEIKVRLSRWKEQEKNVRNSFLVRYAKHSTSSAAGAVLA